MVEQRSSGMLAPPVPGFGSAFVAGSGWVGTTTDVFAFPSVGAQSAAWSGAGDMIGVFSDRPEVREFVRYMLGPEYGKRLAAIVAVHLAESPVRR